jgi:hypothetical protein
MMGEGSASRPEDWMIIEETGDSGVAEEVADLLRAAGIEVRARLEADGEQRLVEVRMVDLDQALEVLEEYDEAG